MTGYIHTEGLGKCYIIGHEKRNPHATLTDRWMQKTRQVGMKTRHLFTGGDLISGNELEEFWALRDVSFRINPGESIGIIGRNGAGKSTLLKLLSRITDPSAGRIRIGGRVASLLEVGTGFHPELSGRENIYLNGAILGMSRKEVRKKFDEIVDFSGIEHFLDTPVKRYSSGMYVRLAFAIAAHMDPDILIVDEVLAVGDAEFQRKCLGKMKEATEEQGRTILFVSHQMQAVSALTGTCLYLEQGRLLFNGPTSEAIARYLSEGQQKSLRYFNETTNPGPKIISADIRTSEGGFTHRQGEKLTIGIGISLPEPLHGGGLTLQLLNPADIPVVQFRIGEAEAAIFRQSGSFDLSCTIPRLRLFSGQYFLTAQLSDNNFRNVVHRLDRICSFEVTQLHSSASLPFAEGSCIYLDEHSWDFGESPA